MTVLHVMSIHDAETLTSANEIQSILENRLRDWVELEVPKSNASTEVVRGVPHEEILKYANASSADLIVITLQGKGFLERALLGSTAERVVRAAQVPVLSLPLSKPLQSTAEEVRDNAAQ
jgi:nucleotide-binding universal stress UspA family protein